jgi:hypothetical protein
MITSYLSLLYRPELKSLRNILLATPFMLFSYGAHADGCSPSLLQGDYSFTVHGQALSADGSTSTAFIDGVGLITFNGDGTGTQEDFVVRNGTEVAGGPPNPSGFHTGETVTYTVNSDCTGALTITLSPGNTRSDAFVITQRGKAIHAVVSAATTNGEPVLLQVYSDFESLNAR